MQLLDTPTLFQGDDYSCGATAICTLLRYDGLPVPKLVRKMSCPLVGMTAETATAVLHAAYGGRICSGTLDVPALRHFTRAGRPVLVLITDPGSGGGHWALARGVARGRVHVQCPSLGRYSVPAAAFEASWRLADASNNWRLERFGVVGFPA